jgi:hypothetical protein
MRETQYVEKRKRGEERVEREVRETERFVLD